MASNEDGQPAPKSTGPERAYRNVALRMSAIIALSALVAMFAIMIALHDVVEAMGPAAEVLVDAPLLVLLLVPVLYVAVYRPYIKSGMERMEVNHALEQALAASSHDRRLLLTVSQTAEAIQRAETIDGLCEAILDEIGLAGYDANVYWLSPDGKSLILKSSTFKPGVLEILERHTGLSATNSPIALTPGSYFHRVMYQKETVFLDRPVEVVAQALPVAARPFAGMIAATLGVKEGVAARIVVGGQPRGMLALSGAGIVEDDLQAVGMLGRQISIAMEKAELMQKVVEMATTDELTGLYNRRRFQELLRIEIDRARRYGRDLSLVMLDIDHFKIVNDTHGHQAGDAVLADLGKLLRDATRETDHAARYGGEEFALLMPETPELAAVGLAERIRESVAEHTTVAGEVRIRFTVSAGVAALVLAEGHGGDDLVRRADEALYQAKRSGRNRVEVA